MLLPMFQPSSSSTWPRQTTKQVPGLTGPPHQMASLAWRGGGDLYLFGDRAHRDRGRAINDDAQGTVVVKLAEQDDRALKVRIHHLRSRDQES
jgi:hypothetical protein